MVPGRQADADEDPAVGLCSRCRHAVRQESARGSAFWRCRRAETDPGFRRYPPLPVRACRGFEAAAGRPDGGDKKR